MKIDTYNIYGLTREEKSQKVELGRWCKYEDVIKSCVELKKELMKGVNKIIEEFKGEPGYKLVKSKLKKLEIRDENRGSL